MTEHLKYLTTANWLRGFAEGLTEGQGNNVQLITRLVMASDLLLAAWNEKTAPPKYTDGTLYARGEK